MKKIKNCLAIFLSFILLFSSIVVVADENTNTTTESAMTGDYAMGLIDAICSHLIMYGRYDKTTAELYKAALKQIIMENPQLYETALKGMLRSLDEHSEYYTPEESITVIQDTTGEIIGIGVTLDFTNPNKPLVLSVIPEAPAEKAGIKAGDIITAVDGIDVIGMKSELTLNLIRGVPDSTVNIKVDRNGTTLSFDMTREKIVGISVEHQAFQEDNEKLMYIKIHSFVSNTAESFKKALDEAKSQNIRNLIIDLRNNGGGLLDQAIQMADYIIPAGKIITTEDHKIQGLNKVYKSSNIGKFNGEIIILINKYSASASEVFSAALYENDVATLMGETSYGKGTIQTLTSLVNGGLLKYTFGYYLTPLGNNINGIGLNPEYFVNNKYTKIDSNKFGSFAYAKVYSQGDTGPEIKTAKEILNFLEIFKGEINDVYDEDLFYAVHAFQTRTNLFPYGVLDVTTQIQLINTLSMTEEMTDNQLAEAFAIFNMNYKE